MGVDRFDLAGRGACGAITALSFAVLQFVEGAVDTDENDVDAAHNGQAVSQTPRLTEDVVHDDVVARQGHSGNGSMESGSGSSQDIGDCGGVELVGSGFRTHRADHVDAHMEVGPFEIDKQLTCDARFA